MIVGLNASRGKIASEFLWKSPKNASIEGNRSEFHALIPYILIIGRTFRFTLSVFHHPLMVFRVLPKHTVWRLDASGYSSL